MSLDTARRSACATMQWHFDVAHAPMRNVTLFCGSWQLVESLVAHALLRAAFTLV